MTKSEKQNGRHIFKHIFHKIIIHLLIWIYHYGQKQWQKRNTFWGFALFFIVPFWLFCNLYTHASVLSNLIRQKLRIIINGAL